MRYRRMVAVAMVGGLAVAGAVAPAGGAAAEGALTLPAGAAAPAVADQGLTVTLVTGDVVQVTREPGGGITAGVVPGTGPSPAFRVYERAGHTHVVPLAARPYLDAGLVDPRLFDVTLLIDQELDDASSPELPLILGYPEATVAGVPAGARVRAALPSVAGQAVAAGKDRVGELWTRLTGSRPGLTRAGGQPRFAGTVERIWLDGRATALLDRSVPHLGAPEAWDLGYDGTGTTVAVLDTGVDADHPDLAGRVADAEAFTPDGDPADVHGHGTHVSSIAAAVAPGTDLLVGKVLGDTGAGRESWVIDGMEWAAAAGADVVNLSLGTFPTDGTDPVSEAVDTLSESGDTLFVVAAGNSGPSPRSVSAPATADAALAVGNSRLDDTLFRTSSRGPRVGDNAIKPELTAPGTGIVAARAGGGHVAATGTSMAAPHVAGAAAILAQQHPEWTGPERKAALIANTVPLAGATVWEQGAGRVAVDRAVGQTVRVSDGTLDLGYLERGGGDVVRTRTLAYHNDGNAPVTLELAVDLPGVTVTPETLTLAPGAAGEATVRLDTTTVPPGEYAARLVATGGPAPLTTAVGYYRQGDLVDLTVRLTDRAGRPAGGHVTLLNYHRGVFEPGGFIEGSVAPGQARVFRVPAASYSVTATVATPDASGRFLSELTVATDPQVRLERNTTLGFDARDAVPVEVETPRDAAPEVLVVGWQRGDGESGGFVDSLLVLPEAGEVERVSVTPTAEVTDGQFDVYTVWHLAEPWLTVRAEGMRLTPTYLAGATRYVGRERAPVVDVGTGPAPGQDLTGAVALLREDPDATPAAQAAAAAAAGAVLALITPDRPGILRGIGVGLSIPAATLTYEEGQRLRETLPAEARLTGVIDTPYTYDLIYHEEQRVPESMSHRVDHSGLATIDARYHDDGGNRLALLTRHPTAPCACSLVRVFAVHQLPYQRTEYVTAGDAVWSASVQGGMTANLRANRLTYRTARYAEAWGAAPLAPTAADNFSQLSTRDGDLLQFRVSGIADAAGRSGGGRGAASSVLYRDGEEVATLFAGFGDVPVPAGEATYTLDMTSSNGDPASGRLSTDTRTVWTFRSGHATGPEPAVLPMLSPVYDLPVSEGNTVNPRRAVVLELSAAYPDHTPATLDTVEVAVSYDGGASWRPVRVSTAGGSVRALLPPAGPGLQGGYASLRVTLADPDGNRVEQTVHRAYRLG